MKNKTKLWAKINHLDICMKHFRIRCVKNIDITIEYQLQHNFI